MDLQRLSRILRRLWIPALARVRTLLVGPIVMAVFGDSARDCLARLLDDSAAASDAEGHWQRFLELAPESPWAEEALQRLEAARL